MGYAARHTAPAPAHTQGPCTVPDAGRGYLAGVAENPAVLAARLAGPRCGQRAAVSAPGGTSAPTGVPGALARPPRLCAPSPWQDLPPARRACRRAPHALTFAGKFVFWAGWAGWACLHAPQAQAGALVGRRLSTWCTHAGAEHVCVLGWCPMRACRFADRHRHARLSTLIRSIHALGCQVRQGLLRTGIPREKMKTDAVLSILHLALAFHIDSAAHRARARDGAGTSHQA